LGYYIGVIKNTLKGLDILPDWSNIVELLTDGILYSIALFILLLILSLPVIVLLIGGSFFIVGEIIGYSSYSDLWNILSFLSILAILLLLYIVVTSLVLWIYIPLATVNFAKKGFFGFFKIRDILKKISLEYIGILLLYTLFYGIYSLISPIILKIILAIFFLTLPPIAILVLLVALLIESIVIFVLGIMFYRAVAKYYREKELKN
ncbi:MAG TPA: DUF4013 domain-containing protein, partial [Methanothermococcus okinawensis]|nr:DUF4013 domain-containing protein [Methanothermococcus okinawensis]